jgi:hypothetical protein
MFTYRKKQSLSKEIRRAEREYMNMHPPPIIGLATALRRINNVLYILRVIVPRHGSVGSVGPDYFHCVVIPLNAVKSE